MTPAPVVREIPDDLVNLRHRADVHPSRRLVENDKPRLLRQRFRDDDLLLVSAGEMEHRLIGARPLRIDNRSSQWLRQRFASCSSGATRRPRPNLASQPRPIFSDTPSVSKKPSSLRSSLT